MAHTDADLRALLADRAAVLPDGAGDSLVSRVAAVDRRVRAMRRRRAASASLGVVVLLLVAGLSGLFNDHDQQKTSPVPAYEQKVGGGLLPRYNGGGEATAYTTFRTDDKREATFTFTPTSWDIRIGLSCDKNMPLTQMVTLEINGKPFMSGNCSPGFSDAGTSYGDARAQDNEYGLRPGEQATMSVRIVHDEANTVRSFIVGPDAQPVYRGVMDNYRVAAAVYSPMPLADYPFPPRPLKLASLDEGGISSGRLLGTVDARSVGPNGHGQVTTRLTAKGVQVDPYAVAPGTVTVTIDGKIVDESSSWTWTGQGYGGTTLTPAKLRSLGIHVKVGDRISVVVSGSGFTDPAWLAHVSVGS
jgi:hypothetical protein